MDKRALRLGHLTMAWNDLHFQFQMFFAFLVENGNVLAGVEMWNVIKSDRTQRDLLNTLANVRISDARTKEGLHWAVDSAAKLASIRNPALHTKVFLWGDGQKPNLEYVDMLSVKNVRYIKDNTEKALKLAAVDMRKLASYVYSLNIFAVSHLLPSDGPVPSFALPRRPKLHSIPLLKEIDAKLNVQKPTKKLNQRKSTSGRSVHLPNL